MAVKIRLSRVGRKNDPKYRIIVVDSKKKRDGKYIDKIGFYDPIPDPFILTVDDKKLKYWVEKGAQLSEGAYKLLNKRYKNGQIA